MIELLAPAGSREALTAAVESGADAVYLAGNMFGARAYADNFDEEGMREAIAFAHSRDVRVHVTVNTIVRDEEMAALSRYLRFLYEAGADAALVQDLGVYRLARQAAPDLPLHASTQMTVHNLEGVLLLQEMGFERVVLSRELSLEDIRYITAHCQVEIETFVHGALCVCYSGQCLMSSMIGGRSGNRGRCAQPCRLPYTLIDAAGRDVLGDSAGNFLLSPRDLNAVDLIPQLLDAGIYSLKIEGRMKRPEYVATIVRTYRKAIDHYLAAKNPPIDDDDRDHLAQVFNRDFTTAYMERHQGKQMMSDRRPNNRGLLVGRVVDYDARTEMVSLKLARDLAVGDQLDFWVKVGGRKTATVTDLCDKKGRSCPTAKAGEEVTLPLDAPVKPHDRVFKVFDAHLMEKARSFFRTGAPVRRVPVAAHVRVRLGEPLSIALHDRDGFTAQAETEFRAESAKKRPLDAATVEKQLRRIGTTIFSLGEVSFDIEDGVMVPVSEINEARRKAFAALQEERMAHYRRATLPAFRCEEVPARTGCRGEARIAAATDTLASVREALRSGADEIVFGGDSYHHRTIPLRDYAEAAQLARGAGCAIVFNTPRLVLRRDMAAWRKLVEGFVRLSPDAVSVHNFGTLRVVREAGLKFYADASLPVINCRALAELAEMGASRAVLSSELTLEQAGALAVRAPFPVECIVEGNLELMVSEYCALGSFLGNATSGSCSMPCCKGKTRYALLDRKDMKFPLVFDQSCHMHVLNGKRLSMLLHAMEFAPRGISFLRIDGRFMEAAELGRRVRLYKEWSRFSGTLIKEQEDYLKELEGKDVTRGHYFRGVQ
mgnify:CR=1 FL=1